MKRLIMLICLGLAAGFLLCGCGGGPGGGPPPEPSLTPEQVAQIEAASQDINNVLLQADDPFSPEALEAAKQAAQSQPAVEQAAVAEDGLVVKYKEGGFEVWQGDIPKITPPADIAVLEEMTRSILANASLTRAPVGTRQAVLIDAVYEDPSFDGVEIVYDTIEQILRAKGFSDVKRLNGPEASIANLKELSGCSVLVMIGHGGWSFVFPFTFPYSVQTGEAWREELYDGSWINARVVKVNVPWGEGEEEIRKKKLRSFAGTTGAFWSYYYKDSHFNNGLFLNLACSSSRYERFRNELFEVGIRGYTGWSEKQTIAPFTAWRMLAVMGGEKTLHQAYDELPYNWKHQDTWGEANLWVGKDDGLNLTLGGSIPEGPQITITSPESGSTTTERTITVQGKITPWEYGFWPEVRTGSQLHLVGTATISVNGESNALLVDDGGNFSHTVGLRAGENTIRVLVITVAVSSAEIQVEYIPTPEISGEIAFVSDRDGNTEIYVMSGNSANQINLTNNLAGDWDPAWSPDGSKIAFVSNRDGEKGIYIMNRDGSGVSLVVKDPEATEPIWFPDGSKIAFAGAGPQYGGPSAAIFIVDPGGENLRKIAEHTGFPGGGPAVSPDGGQIAYMLGTLRGARLRIIDTEGNLFQESPWFFYGIPTSPVWSPDGKTIAFSVQPDDGIGDNDGIYIVDPTTGQTQRLTEIGQNPSWSKDGEEIIFSWEGELYLLNVATQELGRITYDGNNDWNPAWLSP